MDRLFSKIVRMYRNRGAYVRRYLWPLPKFHREAVVMVDGVHTQGGLSDRFRNILSVYSYCKDHDIRFRLHYVYPCNLVKILEPASYDWTISRKELSYSIYDSEEIILYIREVPGTGMWSTVKAQEFNNREHIAKLDATLLRQKRVQYHIYGNALFAKGRFRELFFELFKPSPFLQAQIDRQKNRMAEPYESVTLRFQQLLGDFEEGDFDVLSPIERKVLIDKCLSKIDELRREGYFSTEKILVTSDSPSFLEAVRGLDYVYTIPGKMEHMDFSHNDDLSVCSKSFVDLFLLMESRRLTLLSTGKMYPSWFPVFAAELGGSAYNEIRF